MDAIADRCFQELFDDLIAQADFNGNAKDIARLQTLIHRALNVLMKDRQLYQLLLFGKGSDAFSHRLEDAFVALYLNQIPSDVTVPPEMKFEYRFVVCGMVGVLRSYMLDDNGISTAELVATLAQQMQNGIGNILDSSVKGIPRTPKFTTYSDAPLSLSNASSSRSNCSVLR